MQGRVPSDAGGGALSRGGTEVRLRCAVGAGARAARGHIWRFRPALRPPPGGQWPP